MACTGSRAKFCIVAVAALCSLAAFAPQAPAYAKTVTFSVPNEGFDGTIPTAVNKYGIATGDYQGADGYWHGFVRAADGSIMTFDAPKAYNTAPSAIDDQGTIVGTLSNKNNGAARGFIRTPDGSLTIFRAPGRCSTTASAMNEHGAIAGFCGERGYIRSSQGRYIFFAVPGSSLFPAGINSQGAVAGSTIDGNDVQHSFVRETDGKIIVFDPQGSDQSWATGVDSDGDVAGTYLNGQEHTFLRMTNGTIQSVDPANSLSAGVMGMDERGRVYGHAGFQNGSSVIAFVRDPDGRTRTFAVRGLAADAYIGINGYIIGLAPGGPPYAAFLRIPTQR